MGWWSRRSRVAGEPNAAGAEVDAVAASAMDVADDRAGRPVAAPLTDAETARIGAALAELERRGVDVDDLGSIGAAYDAACTASTTGAEADEAREACEIFGVAIGEHLHRHSALKWAVVTDVFGTDLGLVAARSEAAIVPHNLVSARWMRRETGWVPRVVAHLVSMNVRG